MPRKRPPADRPKLTRQDILLHALKLVNAEGMDGLTMRKLAASLDVEAMSLYNHVKNKDDVVEGMVILVLEQLEIPDQTLPWQAALHHFSTSMYRTFVAHPALVPALEKLEHYTPHIVQGMDYVLGALNDAGLAPQEQVAAFRGLNSLVMGFVMGHTQGLTTSKEEAEAYWQAWDSHQMRESGLPNLTRLAPFFKAVQPQADFDFVLRIFIQALGASERKAAGPTLGAHP